MTGRPRWYIGLAATMHDPALAIVDPQGQIVFAEGSERYLQCKRAYNSPPDDMIRVPQLVREHCPADAELVVAVTWSRAQLARLELATAAWCLPDGVSLQRNESAWPLPGPGALATALRNSLSQGGLNLTTSLQIERPVTLRHYDHHLCHAASAVYTSGFDECAVAVVDGFGEHGPTSCYRYADGSLTPLADGTGGAPSASLGFYYARLCALCGFDPIQGEEWKVMGLAAYGDVDRRLYEILRPLVSVLDLGLVAGCSPAEEAARLGALRAEMRQPGSSPLAAADLARTGQVVFEETMTDLLEALYDRAPSPRLALAGGCALNSAYNGRILERTRFKSLHVPCAPADDGTAIGAALLAFQEDHGSVPGAADGRGSPYLGSRVSPLALRHLLEFGGLSRMTHAPLDVHERAAALLAGGKIVGWMQGHAEFGPRALGNRCVLADPRSPGMKDRINARVKFREEFRPFAPSILDEYGDEYFECYQPSPYMERTLRFRPGMAARVPSVVHVDGTGRVQSVRREWSPRFYDLIDAFARRTGIPLVLNTSLNVMGKPIVHSLEDALGMFFTTGLDALVVEDYLIEK